MSKATIAFFGTMPYDKATFKAVNEQYGFDIKFHTGNLSLDNVSLTRGVEAVCIFVNDNVDAELILRLKEYGVRLIALRCAGYNNVDIAAAQRAGIAVARVPAYSPHAVAEYAVALMLSLNRKIQRASWRTRDGNFSLNGLMGFDMYGNHAFAEANGVDYVSLDELYAGSDIISLHCPLTPETEYLINRESIAKMKRGVMIINTGRGRLIHSDDLIEGLKTKQVGFAGLDVYEEEEPYFYKDKSDKIIDDDTLARLLSFNNVIMTSHQAFFTEEATQNIAHTTLSNVLDFVEGRPLVNAVHD